MVVKKILTKILKRELTKYINIFDKKILTNNGNKIGRKRIYNNNMCLNVLLNILFEGITYRHSCKYIKNKHSFTSIFKRIQIWNVNNIFTNMFTNLVTKYKHKKQISKMFIDSTDILNLNGTKKFTDFGYKFRSKRSTRITLICDKNKVPLFYAVNGSAMKDSKILENNINKIQYNQLSKIIQIKMYICVQTKDISQNKL